MVVGVLIVMLAALPTETNPLKTSVPATFPSIRIPVPVKEVVLEAVKVEEARSTVIPFGTVNAV